MSAACRPAPRRPPECAAQAILQFIDRYGNVKLAIADGSLFGNIYGSPWDLTIANDNGSTAQVFVSNVLTGTVGMNAAPRWQPILRT